MIIIFIQCISEGLKEIHKNKIIHRDVKPENLFLTEDLRIKIGDLGISKQIIEVLGNGTFGTVFKIDDIDDNRYYAIKRINITQFNEHNIHIIKKEAELLSKINSEYAIKYYKSFI